MATLLLAVSAGSPTPPQGLAAAVGDCTPGSDWGTQRGDFAARVIELVNDHRAGKGLQRLTVSPALTNASVWKALHMAEYDYLGHDDPAPPVARTTGERIAACGYGDGWGENIAFGYPTPESVVAAWLTSDGHRRNIENPTYVVTGVGVATDEGGPLTWAQVFGTSAAGSSLPPPPPPPPPEEPGPPAPAPAPIPDPGPKDVPPNPEPPKPAPEPVPEPSPEPTPEPPVTSEPQPETNAPPPEGTPAPEDRWSRQQREEQPPPRSDEAGDNDDRRSGDDD